MQSESQLHFELRKAERDGDETRTKQLNGLLGIKTALEEAPKQWAYKAPEGPQPTAPAALEKPKPESKPALGSAQAQFEMRKLRKLKEGKKAKAAAEAGGQAQNGSADVPLDADVAENHTGGGGNFKETFTVVAPAAPVFDLSKYEHFTTLLDRGFSDSAVREKMKMYSVDAEVQENILTAYAQRAAVAQQQARRAAELRHQDAVDVVDDEEAENHTGGGGEFTETFTVVEPEVVDGTYEDFNPPQLEVEFAPPVVVAEPQVVDCIQGTYEDFNPPNLEVTVDSAAVVVEPEPAQPTAKVATFDLSKYEKFTSLLDRGFSDIAVRDKMMMYSVDEDIQRNILSAYAHRAAERRKASAASVSTSQTVEASVQINGVQSLFIQLPCMSSSSNCRV